MGKCPDDSPWNFNHQVHNGLLHFLGCVVLKHLGIDPLPGLRCPSHGNTHRMLLSFVLVLRSLD